MKKIIGILLVIALVFALGCTGTNSNTNDVNGIGGGNNQIDANIDSGDNFNNLDNFRKVKAGDNISVNYKGMLLNGDVFDSSLSPGRTPLEFVAGGGQVIKGFDAAVIGMKVGDKKTVTIPPKDAYGELEVQYVDINNFIDANQVKVGEIFNNGSSQIKIVSVDGNVVGITNKLSGETLIFEIELVSIE